MLVAWDKRTGGNEQTKMLRLFSQSVHGEKRGRESAGISWVCSLSGRSGKLWEAGGATTLAVQMGKCDDKIGEAPII